MPAFKGNVGLITDISWCDSTVNLEIGCDGCELWNAKRRTCYAGTFVGRYAGKNSGFPEAFDKPKTFLNRLAAVEKWPDLTGTNRKDKPWLNGLPRFIFLDDLGDTFTESLPVDWLAPVWPRIGELRAIILMLTKRPRRMADFLSRYGCPDNVWPGVSVTDSNTRSRIDVLLTIKARRRFVSYEPALGFIDFYPYLSAREHVDWLIVGGESGTSARPSELLWFRNAQRNCAQTRRAFFCKQLGANRDGVMYRDKGIEAVPADLTREVPRGR